MRFCLVAQEAVGNERYTDSGIYRGGWLESVSEFPEISHRRFLLDGRKIHAKLQCFPFKIYSGPGKTEIRIAANLRRQVPDGMRQELFLNALKRIFGVFLPFLRSDFLSYRQEACEFCTWPGKIHSKLQFLPFETDPKTNPGLLSGS